MILWEHLIYFAVPALMLSAFAAWCSYRERRALALFLAFIGITVFGIYIALMWHSLERPPMRTMGETRLWYSFFALIAGLIVYLRWRYRWILYHLSHCVRNHKPPETRDPQQKHDARTRKSLLRTTRSLLHVFLRHAGGSLAYYHLHSCTREKGN